MAIAYIYFNHKEQHKQSAANVINSILQQVSQRKARKGDISSTIVDLYERHSSRGTRPTANESASLLKAGIHNFSKVFIVVDALDECSESQRDILLLEMAEMPSTMRIMVTAGDINSIEPKFENSSRFEIRASNEDINGTLVFRTQNELQLKRLRRFLRDDPALYQTVLFDLTNNSKGM